MPPGSAAIGLGQPLGARAGATDARGRRQLRPRSVRARSLSVCLEITETSLVEDPTGTISVLSSLRDLGVRLNIDDFGTGYSSLLYLAAIPSTS